MLLMSCLPQCRSAILCLLIFFLLLLLIQITTLSHPSGSPWFKPWPDHDEEQCPSLPGLDDILVVLKTGATESQVRVPVHLRTTLRCIPNHIIYSDYEEDVAGHHVHDVLESIDSDIKATNPDFELYNRLQRHGRESLQATELKRWASAPNTAAGTPENPAWRLDKWKFLPMIESAFRYRPEAQWYVFLEADSYIVWPNLLTWLSHIDPLKPRYFGAATQIGDVVFAHGGSGFVVSAAAMQKVAEQRETHVAFYNELTASQWAGDCVLGRAMRDARVQITWSWPLLQGTKPGDVDLAKVKEGKRMWCSAAVSYHHMAPDDVSAFWRFEQKWHRGVSLVQLRVLKGFTDSHKQNQSLLRHKDVFEHFILPQLQEERRDWDNLSDMPVLGVESAKMCRKACEEQQECLQYSYSHHNCQLSSVVKVGRRDLSDVKKVIQSGWVLDHINQYVQNVGACGDEEWILPEDGQ